MTAVKAVLPWDVLHSVEKLATTVHKLATMSKDADNIIKGCRHWESNTMNNEVEIETTDNNLREAKKIGLNLVHPRDLTLLLETDLHLLIIFPM